MLTCAVVLVLVCVCRYEPVDPRPDELIENDRLESLPIDFDFAM